MSLFKSLKMGKKEKTAEKKSAIREKTAEIKTEPQKTERLNPKKSRVSYLKRPIYSEKATAISKNNQYVFLVDNNATKNEVRKDVENRYDVKVTRVNIIKFKGKPKRWATKISLQGRHKKAIVTLGRGFKIDLSV